jgi:hypothetical protein
VKNTGTKKGSIMKKKWHFEEKKNGVCAACLKNFVRKFVEKIYKMGVLEGISVPVLYIGHTNPKG